MVDSIVSIISLEHLPQQLMPSAATELNNIYIEAATSDNTRKAYRQDIRHFYSWGGVLPTTPDLVISYLQHYATTLNSRTLVRRLTALKNWHILQGFLDPTSHPLVRKTLTGIKNVHGCPKEKALALTIDSLSIMVTFLKAKNRLIDWRNSALLQVGFLGAFRRSELIAMQFEDLNFVEEGVEILINHSKTDQTGEGQVCAIPYGDEILCPPTALRTWCEKANIKNGAVFRGIKKRTVLPEAISINYFSKIIKNVARSCNLATPEKYSGHSLRRGFATTASQQGITLSSIMQYGRWKHSDTALGYRLCRALGDNVEHPCSTKALAKRDMLIAGLGHLPRLKFAALSKVSA